MRLAVGASRGQLVAQLLTESLLLAGLGAVAGLMMGRWAISAFRQLQLPTDLPVAMTFQLDRRALLFALVVAVGSAILSGLMPALHASRPQLVAALASRDATAARRRWGHDALVGAQVAVSVVLLVVTTFSYRTFRELVKSGPGYRIDHLLVAGLNPSLLHYGDDETRRFFLQLAERARMLPGVRSVALASAVPMATDDIGTAHLRPEGFQLPTGQESLALFAARVDEQYFDTMNIPIVHGRPFRAEDSAHTRAVAIVNEQYVKQYLPEQEPIGKRFEIRQSGSWSWVEIIGVAKTTKYGWLGEPPTEFVYLPYRQNAQSAMVIIAEAAGDPAALATPLRALVQEFDRSMPMYDVRSMDTVYQMRAIAIFHVILGIIGAMGVMGLALAVIGLYGLVGYTTRRRTKEIGIRMAIGARRLTILAMVVRRGLTLATTGLVIGLAAGFGAQRSLQAAFPDGQSDVDFATYALIAPVVLGATFLGAYLPAHRAARRDPLSALRHD